jgi:hypothetical protein
MDTNVKTMPDLTSFGNVVPVGYQYYEKITTPGADLSLPTAYLKWYNLYPSDAPISEEQDAEARSYLAVQIEQLKLENELGFVILHRAGSYLLLMMMTWRNTNEIWESVWAKEVTQAQYQPTTFPTSHRGTYCVWELGAVWHERDAWVRFIKSKRDNVAKLEYINDRFTGRV